MRSVSAKSCETWSVDMLPWVLRCPRDSPHLAAQKAKGELYFGCAEKDPWTPLSTVQELSRELENTDVDAEVEICPGVDHTFAFPERPTYDTAAAECLEARSWHSSILILPCVRSRRGAQRRTGHLRWMARWPDSEVWPLGGSSSAG